MWSWISLFVLAGSIVLPFQFSLSDDDVTLLLFLWVIIGLFCLILFILPSGIRKTIEKKYKTDYLDALLKRIDSNLTFKKSGDYSFKLRTFNGSSLFSPSNYNALDEIVGKLDNQDVHIQEIEERQKWFNVFRKKAKGALVIKKTDRNIGSFGKFSKVIVSTDYTSDNINFVDPIIIRMANKYLLIGEKVKLEHPKFETLMNCHAYASDDRKQDQILGRYVMTPKLMQNFVDTIQETGASIMMEASCDWYDNAEYNKQIGRLNYYIMINYKNSLFEYKIGKTKLDQHQVKEDLAFAYNLLKAQLIN